MVEYWEWKKQEPLKTPSLLSGVERLHFEVDDGLNLFVLVDPGADGADLVDPGHDREPFGAFSFHLRPILPQGKLELMGNMPKTALEQNIDLSFQSVEDGGIAVCHQKKALELLENLEVLFKESVPVPVVGTDVDPCYPDRFAFHVSVIAPEPSVP